MFRCGHCGQPTKSGEPMTKVVVETRTKQYHYGGDVSFGHEIVKEIGLGECCKAKAQQHAASGCVG